ncbi:phosphate ABC transporter ATP-binding protein PstB [Pediococcus claussenii]|uniref:Phosphate ABC transporter, ATP-binding protein n=1 Tax=Pediococcus claussenii (strain ATCC BAA-344 / DSM 14800 / JCM 18046 / KCTC 3811 / LMG 21948 / P06) TaxID=701521 RepID=G8PC09_PEDCP|nr:phosphate ABC transporter ATP-binding protein PstB [Pediococcus claussenii]AEV94828.1 phosphate ABC transporter, ATP-binding protein [Pediococcus claussenii ATCC BAA-344]ANZ70025.1 phosphate ABC transporter ATP-binding protein [Pediococcus claussenii]ANZ71840.1 phosphate ABC transporter ATP-binding protein [Pediococcus claussenii]KRN21007.1 pstB protein [Pediococcus claussenii]
MKNYDLAQNSIKTFDEKTEIALSTKNLQVYYGDNHAMHDASLSFPRYSISALIGASGSGKSTYLRSLNRMNDGVARVDGEIMYRDLDINSNAVDVYQVRRRIGMVFQRPNPFAKSIYDNIALPLREMGIKNKTEIDDIVEKSLKQAALWDEVKDNLKKSALALSGGQQQRLCIARAIAMSPDILLLDEPASALDPISTSRIEMTLQELKKNFTIIIVTHSMEQASRASDYTAFFHMGHIIEFNETQKVFTKPNMKITEDYISGNFG